MKKKNSKKNRGALKRCFLGAGIFSLFFTCRTAAMEIGGFDVEIGVGENTDYPPGWNEIPGNSEAVLPEETPSYWGEEWEQGTEWDANPYLQPEDPGLRQDPAWGAGRYCAGRSIYTGVPGFSVEQRPKLYGKCKLCASCFTCIACLCSLSKSHDAPLNAPYDDAYGDANNDAHDDANNDAYDDTHNNSNNDAVRAVLSCFGSLFIR